MSDRIYLVKMDNGNYYERFFTSPYTAMAKMARVNAELRSGGQTPHPFSTEMYGVDFDDVPCDHTIVKTFVTGFVNFVLAEAHEHSMILMEKSPCVFELLYKGKHLTDVMVVYVPPNPEDPNDVGFPVLDVLKLSDLEYADQSPIQQFRRMFSEYAQSW